MFVNLINHSHYSIMQSALSISDIVNFSIENKQEYACLVDIDTMFGTMEFYNQCISKKIKPIIGLQINKVVYIAKDNIGLNQLFALSSKQKTNISSCYTISLDNIEIEGSYKNYKIKDIAAKENFCLSKDDVCVLKSIYAIKNAVPLDFVKIDEKNLTMINETDSNKLFSKDSIILLEQMLKSINISIAQNRQMNFVRFDESKDSKKLLEEMCELGLKRKVKSVSDIYIKRLNDELEVINKMGFNDYFLVVQDFINHAKTNNIFIGPGRGSSSGSLVSYVLNITEIDPITNNLIFERFLNIDRKTMPDIDTDIEDGLRYQVVDYIINKYGKDKVANIITFQRMKAKMALTDVGRILGIDVKIIKAITGLYGIQYDEQGILKPAKSNDKINAYYKSYPILFEISEKLIGMPRQTGQHAAGLVICGEQLTNILPTINIDGKNVAQFEMGSLETLGLIKMDLLGLSNLSIIKRIVELISINKKYDIKLNEIELNNRDVFKQMSNGDTIGIFQLESRGMTNLIRKLKPICIEDISLVLALYRPGPMQNIDIFLENKNYPNKINYLNDMFKKYLSNTYGVIVYQEQLMQIVRGVCNYSLAKADIFRRIISKKKKEDLIKLKSEFLLDAIKNRYSKDDADKIFTYIESFADYGFNHSHSLAYAYISYWMAYLKYYYPQEFIITLLEYNNGDSVYIEEAKGLNQKVIQPSILHSQQSFSIHKDSIIFGLSNIKGFGTTTAKKIIDLRNKYSFNNYLQSISILVKNGVGKASIISLIKAGCFDELLENKTRFYLMINIDNIIVASKYLKENGEFAIEPNLDDITPSIEQIKDLEHEQFDLLGVNFSDTKENLQFKKIREKNKLVTLANSNTMIGVYKTVATIIGIKELNTKYGAQMAFITIKDDTKSLKITFWPAVYSKCKNNIKIGENYIFEFSHEDKGDIGKGINPIQ